jgi:hypothetical protein
MSERLYLRILLGSDMEVQHRANSKKFKQIIDIEGEYDVCKQIHY